MPPGTGKGRGRAAKGRVEEMRAESSPARRTTRQQQHHHQNAIPEEQELENIDPSLTDGQETSPVPDTRLKIGQRGTRRDPERQESFGPSLSGRPSSPPNPSSNYGSTQPEMAPLSTPPRGPSVTSSNPNGIPSWKKKRAPQSLSRLWEATKDLFDHLSAHPYPLRDPTTLSNDEMEELKDWDEHRPDLRMALDAHRRIFLNHGGDPVILPNFVLDLMEITPSSPEGLQTSRAINATNFVTLLEGVLTVSEENALSFLEACDEWFPLVFFEEDDCKVHLDKILEIVLGIRTQRLIFTLRRGDLESADLDAKIKSVASIFCSENTNPEDLIQDFQQNDMGIRRIPFIDIDTVDNGDFHKNSYTHRVREIISVLKTGDVLEEDWPFDKFRHGLYNFAQDSFERLKATLERTSGDDASRVESQQILSQLESESFGHGSAYMDTSQDIISTAAQQGSPFRGPAPYPPSFGNVDNGSMYAESAAQVGGRKRPAPDPSAPGKAPKRARRKANASRVTTQPSVTASMEANAGSLVHPQYHVELDTEAVTQLAKERSAEARKGREPQVRSPWVQPDIRLLIQAVHTYQCKWSDINKAIKSGELPFERPRDQQALRDKARLLKQDFLKADSILPPSFDLVVLGRKEKASVIAVGKNPDRKEADVAIDPATGNLKPTNTEYAPEGQQRGEEYVAEGQQRGEEYVAEAQQPGEE
ncbi:hypothetical protein V8F33_000956 [Rhypophila sp. PSN 637]